MSEPTSFKRPDLPKRFYAAVSVAEAEGGYVVFLDGKAIRTPLRRPLTVPTRGLAERLAGEWEAQAERIDPSTMPVTRLVNTVLDGIADDPAAVRDDLVGYVETDLLFYRASYPESLIRRQQEAWDPIVRAAERFLGARFVLAEGVIHAAQPASSIEAFRAEVASYRDPFAVAALHQMTTLTGSALVAMAIAKGWLDVEAAWAAAHVDEDWNIEQWGADEEAAIRRAARFKDMRVAADLLAATEAGQEIW